MTKPDSPPTDTESISGFRATPSIDVPRKRPATRLAAWAHKHLDAMTLAFIRLAYCWACRDVAGMRRAAWKLREYGCVVHFVSTHDLRERAKKCRRLDKAIGRMPKGSRPWEIDPTLDLLVEPLPPNESAAADAPPSTEARQ